VAQLRLITCAFLLLLTSVAAAGTTVENIRIWSENNKTRVVLDLSDSVEHSIFTLRGPDRLVIDLKSSRLGKELTSMPRGAGAVRSIRSAVRANGQLRVVLDLNSAVRSRTFTAGPNATYGDRLVIDLQPSGNLATVKRASESYRPGRDIVIAIDAGHGGHDPGSIGPRKTREKDVALQISRELAKRINAEPGMKAVLIRDRDVYIDHRERTAIARRHKADLFVSVHADSVSDSRARGASVYALSLKGASDEAARQLARRENASVGGVSLDDKDDVLASVLLDLSQNAVISASRDAASRVLSELDRIGELKKTEVQHASLIVLTSPDIPSMLIETAYISNPEEEKKLRDPSHQVRLATAIHAGVRRYFYDNPPPGTRVAQLAAAERGQPLRHVVAAGESLSELAGRYAVSVESLQSHNKLADDTLRVGTVLEIPARTSGT